MTFMHADCIIRDKESNYVCTGRRTYTNDLSGGNMQYFRTISIEIAAQLVRSAAVQRHLSPCCHVIELVYLGVNHLLSYHTISQEYLCVQPCDQGMVKTIGHVNNIGNSRCYPTPTFMFTELIGALVHGNLHPCRYGSI